MFSIASLGQSVSYAQRADELFFPETGHTVRGEFLAMYQKASDPVKIYGYPITDAFQNQHSGRIVQYFQRAHFELRPENPPELRVHLTLLGEILYTGGQNTPLSIPANYPPCRTFSETAHQVCYAFLEFFDANGGIAQFGYPISEIELENGRMVQYFQRSRVEWRPELTPGKRVTVSDLGRIYFDLMEDPVRLKANKEDATSYTVLNLNVRAFFTKSVTSLKGNQTLFVIVQDQNLLPVRNAQVIITLRFPSGRVATNVMPLTDELGVSRLTFTFEEQDYGVVEVDVEATSNYIQKSTRASYRLYY